MRELTLVDTPGYIYRAYHATQPLVTSKGVPVNAAYGFTRMMFKMFKDLNPTHLALCFDLNGRAGRVAIDPNYKATRPHVESALTGQFKIIRDIAGVMNLPCLEFDGWEADDVIATVSKLAIQQEFCVNIVTSDKDFLQILRNNVRIYDPVKATYLDDAYIYDRYGVYAKNMVDYQALIGDSTDNVPKVPGVGTKTAAKLITQFGTVANLLANVEEVENIKLRKSIVDNQKQLLMAYDLVKFREDLPMNIDVQSLVKKDLDDTKSLELFKELEFKSIISDVWGINTHFSPAV